MKFKNSYYKLHEIIEHDQGNNVLKTVSQDDNIF